jgi:hypothetical protein
MPKAIAIPLTEKIPGWPEHVPQPERYAYGECTVLVGREPVGVQSKIAWHFSISHMDRDPTWEEIRDARYELCPDNVTMAMLLPPKDQYVNRHDHCFHLWEI